MNIRPYSFAGLDVPTCHQAFSVPYLSDLSRWKEPRDFCFPLSSCGSFHYERGHCSTSSSIFISVEKNRLSISSLLIIRQKEEEEEEYFEVFRPILAIRARETSEKEIYIKGLLGTRIIV